MLSNKLFNSRQCKVNLNVDFKRMNETGCQKGFRNLSMLFELEWLTSQVIRCSNDVIICIVFVTIDLMNNWKI